MACIWRGWASCDNANPYETLLKEAIFVGIQNRRISGFKNIQLLRHDHAVRFGGGRP
jgi:hypothetical protein